MKNIIKKSVSIILLIAIVDFLSIIFRPIRNYHFNDFPNMHFIGIFLLFILAIGRFIQARNEGKIPYLEVSREWRIRKDMLGPYDYLGPDPDYSNNKINIIYLAGILISFGLITLEFNKYFF